jgi:soluble lytic murein transglycosylase-like protein
MKSINNILLFNFAAILLIYSNAYSANWNTCFDSAGEIYNIDKNILLSIAKVESNHNPYALNINGEGIQFRTVSDALFAISTFDRMTNADIGIMQVNLRWFRKYKIPYKMGYNPCFNIHLGAYILAYELYNAKGDINAAIGKYHSPSKERQTKYTARVAEVYNKLPK